MWILQASISSFTRSCFNIIPLLVPAGDRGRAAESERLDPDSGGGAGWLQGAGRALEGADDLRQTGVSSTLT